jgi:epoxyqueuosine reductase QueG
MLEEKIRKAALDSGADLVGIAEAKDIVEKPTGRDPRQILPEARSVVVLAIKYLDGALNSPQMRIAVNDCRQIDLQLGQISRKIGRLVEESGFQASIIPSYFPIEMTAETKGLIGDISLKQAGVAAGLGEIGIHGLLITPQYGPRIRLAAVLTEMPVKSSKNNNKEKLIEYCASCGLCIEKCPAKAITRQGVDVNKCVKYVGRPHGLSSLIKFIISAIDSSKEEVKSMVRSPEFWNYYQNFMVGVHFNCHTCQSICPIGKSPAINSLC